MLLLLHFCQAIFRLGIDVHSKKPTATSIIWDNFNINGLTRHKHKYFQAASSDAENLPVPVKNYRGVWRGHQWSSRRTPGYLLLRINQYKSQVVLLWKGTDDKIIWSQLNPILLKSFTTLKLHIFLCILNQFNCRCEQKHP